jgi:FMN phosphatase YigB (HAD superfamily)
VTRSYDGGKTSRQGTPSIETQFDNLISFLKNRDLFLVDDGIFSGGTSNYVAGELEKRGVEKSRVKKFIGFIGNNEKVAGIKTNKINPIENMFEWVDIRDFSVFGGKKYEQSRNNFVSTSIPYLFPWSDGSGASFDKLENFFELSKGMITSFKKLICVVETKTGQEIKIRDLVKSGFPIPTNVDKTIPISINMALTDYLDSCIKTIEVEQKRRVVIFDMDGTMYLLDGKNNGFSNSTLEAKILENALAFIIKNENCSIETAEKIRQEGLEDPIGLSAFLSKRYQMSRGDYFNYVWNISPENIITDYETPVDVITKLKLTDKKLILLTSAPRIWQQRVINYLRLDGAFEVIYTGENYGKKDEIFKILSQRYSPKNMISAGDQEKTDILPAKQVGIKGLLVNNPKDLVKLLDKSL